MLYPISYSVPEEIIVPYVPFKTCFKPKEEYGFPTPELYLKNYRQAIFGDTRLKCGWDCLRHYEILSQGTIPYFQNLQACPKKTLHIFPKGQILTLMEKYGEQTFEDIMKNSSSILYNDIDDLLNYTRQHLTTRQAAEYILSKTKTPDTQKLLLIHNTPNKGDYMLDFTAHGLQRKTDGALSIFPEIPYLYNDYPLESTQSLYGKGFNYTRFLPSSYKKSLEKEQVTEKIKQREYDHIFVYVQCTGQLGIPLFSDEHVVLKYYEPQEISFICGRDCDPYWSPELNWYIRMNHTCSLRNFTESNNMNLFVREFGD